MIFVTAVSVAVIVTEASTHPAFAADNSTDVAESLVVVTVGMTSMVVAAGGDASFPP